jgi:hypothetical protein
MRNARWLSVKAEGPIENTASEKYSIYDFASNIPYCPDTSNEN